MMTLLYELIENWRKWADEDGWYEEVYTVCRNDLIRVVGCMAVAQELGVEP